MIEMPTMRPTTVPGLEAVAERYAALPLRPLRVTLEIETGSNLVAYDPVNLDNLLARAVLEEATEGRASFSVADDEYLALPVPLACLWRDGDGLPLWAATPFVPAAEAYDDVVYWHKRPQEGAFTRGGRAGTWSPKSAGNRYAERRIPTPVVACDAWAATCVGNPDEVARLLAPVRHVGKNRGAGHGVVRAWRIAAIDRFSLVDGDGRLARNLPEGARSLLGADGWPEGEAAPLGWTPPQWRPALFRPGWRLGTPVHRLGGGAS